MVVVGGLGMQGFAGQHPTRVGYALAAILIAAGVLLLVRLRFAVYTAFAAATLLSLSGVAGLTGHTELGMPMPPVLSVVVGLYLILRIALTGPTRPPRDLADPTT